VGDGEQPLDEREPAVEVVGRIGIVEVKTNGLWLIGRGIAVIHPRDVDAGFG
jgi:hypothetical protein